METVADAPRYQQIDNRNGRFPPLPIKPQPPSPTAHTQNAACTLG